MSYDTLNLTANYRMDHSGTATGNPPALNSQEFQTFPILLFVNTTSLASARLHFWLIVGD